MKRRQYTLIPTLVQKFGSTKAGSWFFARTIHHLDRLWLRLTGGQHSLTDLLAGIPTVIVECTGAKSGLPRTIPLLYIPDPQDQRKLALIGTNFGQKNFPAWYFNLKANPHTKCTFNGQTGSYLAVEVDGDEYIRLWEYAKSVYTGYELYRKRCHPRRVPIILLEPEERSVNTLSY